MRRIVYAIIFLIPLILQARTIGFLGVFCKNLDEPMLKALNISYGVLVEDVEEGSPADEAGIQMGDVILKVDNEEIWDVDDLRYVIKKRPGKKVEIVILRGGKKKTLEVKLGKKEYHMRRIIIGKEKIEIPEYSEDLERFEKEFMRGWREFWKRFERKEVGDI